MPAPCKDEHRSCKAWAARGDCHGRALYMMKYCKQSCNLCQSIGLYERGKLFTFRFYCQLSEMFPDYASIFSHNYIIFFQSPRVKSRHALTNTVFATNSLKKATVNFFPITCTRNAPWAVKLVTQVMYSSRLLSLSVVHLSLSAVCNRLSLWLDKQVQSEGVKAKFARLELWDDDQREKRTDLIFGLLSSTKWYSFLRRKIS